GPATVRLRRYGAKLLQNSSDSTRPRAPAIIRMIPTVLRLKPEVVTSTAKVKMAPTTSRKMLTPRLKAARLLQDASIVSHSRSPACMRYLVRPFPLQCCYGSWRQRQGGAGAAERGPRPESPTGVGTIGRPAPGAAGGLTASRPEGVRAVTPR